MKKSIFILAAVALLAMVSCNNKAKENQNQESAATVALSVDDILAEGDRGCVHPYLQTRRQETLHDGNRRHQNVACRGLRTGQLPR